MNSETASATFKPPPEQASTTSAHISIAENRRLIAGHGGMLADNRIALYSGWDESLLELGELKDARFDLGLMGFEDGKLGRARADPRTI